MAKWRRGGGGRRRGRWVIEEKPLTLPADHIKEIEPVPDPFTFDSPDAIRAALWRFEQRKMLEDYHSPVVCDA